MNNAPINYRAGREHDRWRYINWLMITIIAFIAFVIVGLVSLGFFRASDLYQKYIPLADAEMEMRMEAISAYLWFEEMVGGDESITMDRIVKHLDRADWYAEAMIKGGENIHLKLKPSEHIEIYEDIVTLQSFLKEQRNLLKQRFESMQISKPGSEIDKVYHAKLAHFIDLSTLLEMKIKKIMAHQYQKLNYVWLGVIVCCLCIFLVSGTVFYRYERLRRNHYLEILKMQNRLVQSEKMAALGNLITGFAHQINNPNGFISFNIPILRDYVQGILPIIDEYAEKNGDLQILNLSYAELRDDLFTTLKNIENGSQRINRIVNDLKEFCIKKDQSSSVCCDLKEVLKSAINFCDSKLKNRVSSFKVTMPEDLPPLYCDPEIVRLIMINFLTNAAEAIDKDNSWIELNVKSDSKELNNVVVEVSDNGRGIEESNIDKIFDPFYSSKPPKEGTGLGLYLCEALADLIGARIEVESAIGQGSTFRLITGRESIRC